MTRDLWGITTFFNPERYTNKRELYMHFREASKRQGLPLLVIEMVFGDAPYEITDEDAEKVIRVRGTGEDLIWQKERLINLGLSELPPECAKFVWLDADIIFDNDAWVEESSRLLDEYPVIQPFEMSVKLTKEQGSDTHIDIAALPEGLEEGQKLFSYAESKARPRLGRGPEGGGHIGFAWGARRDVFEGVGLYDRHIAGSNDSMMAWAFYGKPLLWKDSMLSPGMLADYKKWRDLIWSRVNGKVHFAQGTVFHLWHGGREGRFYSDRNVILERYAFDPGTDIAIHPDGYWVWSSKKPGLHKMMSAYFGARNEEGTREAIRGTRRFRRMIRLCFAWKWAKRMQLKLHDIMKK